MKKYGLVLLVVVCLLVATQVSADIFEVSNGLSIELDYALLTETKTVVQEDVVRLSVARDCFSIDGNNQMIFDERMAVLSACSQQFGSVFNNQCFYRSFILDTNVKVESIPYWKGL